MRISTAMQFSSGTRNLLSQQYELQRTQDQLSSGRRMLAPSDDPIAALNALEVQQAKGVNEQYLSNQSASLTALSALESTLGSLGDQLINIRVAAAEAQGKAPGSQQLGIVAEDLKQRLNSLVDLANTKDVQGNYVFSGFQAGVKPFELNNVSGQYEYRGDQGQVSIQIAPSLNMVVAENGDDLFMRVRDGQGQALGKSVFQTVQDAITQLESGAAFDNAAYATNLSEIDSAINHLLNARTSAGSRLNTLESVQINSEDMDYQHSVRLSELQDLDYTEAISRFARYQTQLEASQITFKQVTQLSLFNLL
jgi:flagellar hook-associated protein 3 FlgL